MFALFEEKLLCLDKRLQRPRRFLSKYRNGILYTTRTKTLLQRRDIREENVLHFIHTRGGVKTSIFSKKKNADDPYATVTNRK